MSRKLVYEKKNTMLLQNILKLINCSVTNAIDNKELYILINLKELQK